MEYYYETGDVRVFFNDSFCKVHFDRKSCLLMGKRYAKVYADMFARP